MEKDKILEEIIDYNKLLSDNPNTNVFKINKINNLVNYIKQRNLNNDIQDIKAEIIVEITRIVKYKNLGDYYNEKDKYINTLCRILFNNINFKYKTTNNMYAIERYKYSLEDSYNELSNISDINNTVIQNNCEKKYMEYIDFIINNKKKIFTDKEILLLNELLYDVDRSCKATVFSTNSRKLLKLTYNCPYKDVRNKINSLILKIKRKFIIWDSLNSINKCNDYTKAINYIYKDYDYNLFISNKLLENKSDIILILEYKLFNKDYLENKYPKLFTVKNIEMKIYNIKRNLLKKTYNKYFF